MKLIVYTVMTILIGLLFLQRAVIVDLQDNYTECNTILNEVRGN